MESKNRTRNAQKQFADFMKDAGCDPSLIQDEFSPRPHPIANLPKKPLYKHIDVDSQLSYPANRHKKIQKSIKRSQKSKLKIEKVDTDYAASPYNDQQLIYSQPHNNDHAHMEIQKESKNSTLVPEKSSHQLLPAVRKYFSFPFCVNKANNNFYGYFGHSTILLSEPVIEGSYYMEVNVLDPYHPNHPKGKQFQSCIRIGICLNNHHLLVPLGGQNSYCYKSKDGSMVHSNNLLQSHQGSSYKAGDTIGMFLHLSPPYRFMKTNHQNNGVNEGSRLVFYKNGQKSCEVGNLNQHFYNFGVSLFNWANININMGPDFKYQPSGDCKPISNVFSQKHPYSDLKI